MRYCALALAWISVALGFVGVFVPVLPTTPFLLLAAALFARFSPRFHSWLESTRLYQSYVVPFKENKGLSLKKKLRILLISYAVLGLSAYFAQKLHVWIILSCVAVFLAWLMFIRIPTIKTEEESL